MHKHAIVAFATAFLLLPCAAPADAQSRAQPALSPSQSAFLKAESRRVEDLFVARVAGIVGTEPERVRRAMPDDRRITVTVSRLIVALEMDLGRALSDEQHSAIMAADSERRAALARVRDQAARR